MLEIIQALRFLQILNYYRVKFEFEEIFLFCVIVSKVWFERWIFMVYLIVSWRCTWHKWVSWVTWSVFLGADSACVLRVILSQNFGLKLAFRECWGSCKWILKFFRGTFCVKCVKKLTYRWIQIILVRDSPSNCAALRRWTCRTHRLRW